jgi:hypothetical protein
MPIIDVCVCAGAGVYVCVEVSAINRCGVDVVVCVNIIAITVNCAGTCRRTVRVY